MVYGIVWFLELRVKCGFCWEVNRMKYLKLLYSHTKTNKFLFFNDYYINTWYCSIDGILKFIYQI